MNTIAARHRLPRLLAAFVLALLPALVGCAYSYAPVLVEVRDRATHEPISGASVRIANTRTLNPNPPDAAEGVTDERGAVVLNVALYNDITVRLDAAGHAEHVFTSEHPSAVGAGSWMRPIRTQGGVPPTLQIRLAPTTSTQLPHARQSDPPSAPNRPD